MPLPPYPPNPPSPNDREVANSPWIVWPPSPFTLSGYVLVQGKRGQQWDTCDRCGRQQPMGNLIKQKGLLICIDTCFDDLTIERRSSEITRLLGEGVDEEGIDRRAYDRSFFEGVDEEVR